MVLSREPDTSVYSCFIDLAVFRQQTGVFEFNENEVVYHIWCDAYDLWHCSEHLQLSVGGVNDVKLYI